MVIDNLSSSSSHNIQSTRSLCLQEMNEMRDEYETKIRSECKKF